MIAAAHRHPAGDTWQTIRDALAMGEDYLLVEYIALHDAGLL